MKKLQVESSFDAFEILAKSYVKIAFTPKKFFSMDFLDTFRKKYDYKSRRIFALDKLESAQNFVLESGLATYSNIG